MKRISFDPVAQIFDSTRGPPEHVKKQLLVALRRELAGCKTILDAGVGTGRFAKPLQDAEFEVVGIDLSQKMLGVAKEKGVANLFRGDLCFIPFKDSSFEAAICNAVLHLIPEWKEALQEICRVTTNVMVSTVHERGNPMREAYVHILEKYGYEDSRRRRPERDLENLVPPSKRIHVATYYVDMEQSLAHMSQRAFSHQWIIPQSVNNDIVTELRKQFSGKRVRQGLSILIWNIDDLKVYLRKKSA